MVLDYSLPGKIVLTMFKYLEDIIVEAPKDSKKDGFPVNNKLFKAYKGAKLLEPKRADIFHHIVARLSYANKRTESDITVAIAFLCTRVQKST